MLIRTQHDGFIHPLSSEITSPQAYATRRQLLRQWTAGAAAAGLAGWAQREAFADHAGRVMGLAAETFNDGLRAYYMSFAAVAWFFSAWAFMAATAAVLVARS